MTPEQWQALKDDRALTEAYFKTGGRFIKGPYSQFNYKARRKMTELDKLHRRLARRQDIGAAERTRRAEQVQKHIDKVRDDLGNDHIQIERKQGNAVQRGIAAVKNFFRKGGDR